MPMKKNIDIDDDLYNSRIRVNGFRVYRVSDQGVFVEIYKDCPSIRPAEFWESYAYSGEADKWFPQLDPETIQFSVSPGQYDIGSDVKAYGRLTNANEVVVQKIKESMEYSKKVKKRVKEINKQIVSLQDEIFSLNKSSNQEDIKL